MFRLLLARLHNRWIRHRLRGKKLDSLAWQNLGALDHLNHNQPARSLRYVVFDVETTGLSLNRDRVLSVAAFRIADGRILLGDIFNSLVNPNRPIPASAIKIHGIMPSMVAHAPTVAKVFEQFLRYLGTDILIGYQVRFDLHFLNTYMKQRYGFPIQNLVLDMQSVCRKFIFPSPFRSYMLRFKGDPDLDSMAKHFGIEIFERHSALGDALATAMIFQRILSALDQKRQERLKDLLSL